MTAIAPELIFILLEMDLTHSHTGLQLRKSEQNGFHDIFLIFQPKPMM